MLYSIFQYLPFDKLVSLLSGSTIAGEKAAINALKRTYGLQITENMPHSEQQVHIKAYDFNSLARKSAAFSLFSLGHVTSLKEAYQAIKGLYLWQSIALNEAYFLGLRREHILKLKIIDLPGSCVDIGSEHAHAFKTIMGTYQQTPNKTIEILNKIEMSNVAWLFTLIEKEKLSMKEAAYELSYLNAWQGETLKTLYSKGLRRHHLLALKKADSAEFHKAHYEKLSALMLTYQLSPEKAIEVLILVNLSNIDFLLQLAKAETLSVYPLASEFNALSYYQALTLRCSYPLGIRRQHIIEHTSSQPMEYDFNHKHAQHIDAVMRILKLAPIQAFELIDKHSEDQLKTLLLLVGTQGAHLKSVLPEINHLTRWECLALEQGYSNGLKRQNILEWKPANSDSPHSAYAFSQASSTTPLMTFFKCSPSQTIEIQSTIPSHLLLEIIKQAKKKHLSIENAYQGYLEEQKKNDDDLDFSLLN